MMTYYYGQIRPTNYNSLKRLYGHEPPWDMLESPHVDLVKTIMYGYQKTKYAEYISDTHSDYSDFDMSVTLVRKLLDKEYLENIDLEHDCVIDGNHRMAVHLVTGKPVKFNNVKSYQSIYDTNDGRRYYRKLDTFRHILRNKIILDAGCNLGMNSFEAIKCGAKKVITIDNNLTSKIWLLRKEFNMEKEVEIQCADLNRLVIEFNYDIVFLFSVAHYLNKDVIDRMTKGKMVFFEEQYKDQCKNIMTNHYCKYITIVPYSVDENKKTRKIFICEPK